jgi:ribosome maturation factor RimP
MQAEVIAAVVTGVFSLGAIAMQIRHLRAENTQQHGESRELLSRLDERSAITLDRVETVSERLDDHLEQHREIEGGRLPRSDRSE